MPPTQQEINNTLRQMEISEHPLTLARERIEDFRSSREREGIQCHDFYPPDLLWEVWKSPIIRPSIKMSEILYPKK